MHINRNQTQKGKVTLASDKTDFNRTTVNRKSKLLMTQGLIQQADMGQAFWCNKLSWCFGHPHPMIDYWFKSWLFHI